MRALAAAPVRRADAGEVMGREPAVAERLIGSLVSDRLVEATNGWLRLPG